MKKLVLIDGNAILHRAYHALPPLTSKDGKPINAVYGFITMLLRILQDLKPTHLIVAFDEKEPTFRHEEFEEYQAHRPEADEELIGQFDKARRTIKSFGIPIYSKKGYEADDVIGTLARQAEKKMDEIVIVTGDRDILQLVNGKTKVFLPIKGLSNGKVFEKEDVKEKMGVGPDRIVDLKALMGDPSDNYPGVSGIGPVTANKLLKKFGSFKGVYENLDEIKGSTKEKLEKDKENAELSYKLARIVTDAPVEFDEKKAVGWKMNRKEAMDVFDEFGFKKLTKRIEKIGEELEKEKQGKLF